MAKTKTLGVKAQNIAAKGFYGEEPVAGSDLTKGISYTLALNWYNNFYEHNKSTFNGRECFWLDEYMTGKQYSVKDIAAARRADTIRGTDVVKCRLILNDCILPDGSVADLDKRIKDAVAYGRMKTIQMFGDRLGPAERNKRKALEFRGDLDYLYDRVWEGKLKPVDIEFFTTFEAMGMKPKQAQVLLPVYREVQLEEQDKEIPHSKKNIKARQAFMKELIESLEAWSKGKEEKPEPKIKKPVTERKIGKRTFKSTRPAATVTSLKFKTIDEETKIASISPKQILGAQMVILYNAKYKQLAILRAANAEGLSVKGTTILNVDETTSEAKRAGRHTAAIKEMVSAPKTKIAKLFKAITADPIPVRTRTSEDIVLVRAIK